MIRFYRLTISVLAFTTVFLGTTKAQSNVQLGRNVPYTAIESTKEEQGIKSTRAALVTIKDSIFIGNSQSETDHNLTGTNMNSGLSNGKNWINSDKGYMSFELTPDSVVSNEITCMYWGGDIGRRAFDIQVEGIKISTQRLNNNAAGKFFSVTYAIPLALTRHKAKVVIKFQSKTDSIAGDLYGCRISLSATPSYNWPLNIHDPSSVIKCGDTYWIFGTGDGILAASSKDLIKWRYEPSPFAKWDIPSYIFTYVSTFEGTYWAPECIFMNGKYYLYYSASQWGTKLSCIGVATNTTLNPEDPAYKWVDKGVVFSSNHGSNYNAIDPAVMRDPQTGKIWLTYGSFNIAGIKVTELDSVSGKIKNSLNQTSVCNHYVGTNSYNGEASFMIYHNNYYYLFVNYGGCCAGTNSSYYIVTGRSASPTGPFLDKNGANMYKEGSEGGGTTIMKHDNTRFEDDRYYGPGCLGYFVENGVEYATFHYYDPNFPWPGDPYKGGPMLAISKLKWDANGWPVISFDWLDQGRYKVRGKNSGLYWDKSSTSMIQATQSAAQSQQWDLIALGTGEYKISNSSAVDNFVETSGSDRKGPLQLNAFTDAIYEKFRIMKSTTNELYFYQSAGLLQMEVPYASWSSGVQLGVWWFNDCDCQKWYATWVSDIPNGIKDIRADGVVNIYPNPVLDKFTVKEVSSGSKIEVMDISGKVISSAIADNPNTDIDLTGKPNGVYYIRISDNNGIKSAKILKK